MIWKVWNQTFSPSIWTIYINVQAHPQKWTGEKDIDTDPLLLTSTGTDATLCLQRFTSYSERPRLQPPQKNNIIKAATALQDVHWAAKTMQRLPTTACLHLRVELVRPRNRRCFNYLDRLGQKHRVSRVIQFNFIRGYWFFGSLTAGWINVHIKIERLHPRLVVIGKQN